MGIFRKLRTASKTWQILGRLWWCWWCSARVLMFWMERFWSKRLKKAPKNVIMIFFKTIYGIVQGRNQKRKRLQISCPIFVEFFGVSPVGFCFSLVQKRGLLETSSDPRHCQATKARSQTGKGAAWTQMAGHFFPGIGREETLETKIFCIPTRVQGQFICEPLTRGTIFRWNGELEVHMSIV